MNVQQPIVRFTWIGDLLQEFVNEQKDDRYVRKAVVATGESLGVVVTALVNGTVFRFDHDCGSSDSAEAGANQMHHRIDTLCDMLRIEIRRGIWEHSATSETVPD